MIIAVDGPAASGKGTLSKRLAAHYGLPHLDTGLLYRAVAHALLIRGVAPSDEAAAVAAAQGIDPAQFDELALKAAAVGDAASVVSAFGGVRQALLQLQKGFAAAPQGAVLDGRDIGTVICPDARVKLFVTASPQVRAHRRTLELASRGEPADPATVLADILKRDERDRSRSAAPLVQADDAMLLDTSELGIEPAFAAALALVESRIR